MNLSVSLLLLRLSIGSVFTVAAMLKLFSIDEFELYIYSFDMFSFTFTTLLSRLIIAGEMILGSFLLFNISHRFTWLAALTAECVFTAFLIYAAASGNDDNCHCFGELIELNPKESIMKNMIMTAALFLIKNDTGRKHKPLLPTALVVASLAASFIATPMDAVYNKLFYKEKEINSSLLYNDIPPMNRIVTSDNGITVDTTLHYIPGKENEIVVMASSGCRYCRLGIRKMSLIVKNKELDNDNINIVIWGSDDGIKDFIDETDTQGYHYWRISPRHAIDITYGRFPMFIRLENGVVIETGDFRKLEEML